MKKILMIFLVVALLFVAGCSSKNQIVGKWELVSSSDTTISGLVYVFLADGTFYTTTSPTSIKEYKMIDNNNLRLIFSKTETKDCEIKFGYNIMHWRFYSTVVVPNTDPTVNKNGSLFGDYRPEKRESIIVEQDFKRID